jgi:hypothetical protein
MEGKTNGEFSFTLEKHGYYKTREDKYLFHLPDVSVSGGRWQPYGMTNMVVLKRQVNPVAMCVKRNSRQDIFPGRNQLYGYDMQVGDWVKPWGKGKQADFHLSYEREDKGAYLDIKTVLTLVFTNAFDGVYEAKADGTGSAMNVVYNADTNAVYKKQLIFVYDRTTNKIMTDTCLSKGDYLVLRTRSECDEDGNLKKAHYAKIRDQFDVGRKDDLWMVYYFNPNENDPNLEADTTKNLLNPKDLGFAP